MTILEAIIIAVLSSVLTLIVKIIFDWLKGKGNGNGGGYSKLIHDDDIKFKAELMALLKRTFENVVENQKLLRDVLDELIRRR